MTALLRRRPAQKNAQAPATEQTHLAPAPPPAVRHATNRNGSTGGSPRQAGPTFLDLPPELHLQISQYLIYPDALSLKHANRYFHNLVFTGVRLKVEWLVQRRSLHLDCPSHTRCDMGSDLRFCRGSVALLMKRRREHIECESKPGLGCVVYSTPTCSHRRSFTARWTRWLRTTFTAELWWLLLAAIPLVFCGAWVAELLRVDGDRAVVDAGGGA
ncbi:uncharacterized protein DNG_01485 [Cephalotrichum gorgonifer]|uniref:F-box domain-containing protein n=1 Tax=Cephalotrichum gorgonifer TaxID=2041049 RepID=A0AAE8MQZ2_9PEZI|nr:uncharacterized protein DNG_01485 [Cephalotrichum gorgonifer]